MKLFIAGLQRYDRLIEQFRPKYVLESYHYVKKRKSMEFFLSADMFLLDSGAFTFLSSGDTSVNWTKYVENYADFINRHKIDNFFELDIYKIIGIEKTESLRSLLETQTGKKCIPVWHRHLGLKYLHNLSENYSYIGFGGFAIADIKPNEYKFIPKLLEICAKNDCRVHGLGFTNQQSLKACKFWSVDSTSWNGGRFGTVFTFQNGFLKQNRRPDKRVNITDTIPHNLGEWIKFQNYAETYL